MWWLGAGAAQIVKACNLPEGTDAPGACNGPDSSQMGADEPTVP